MHELSVCMSLLSQVKRLCVEHKATRVHRIKLQIGPLSGVEATLLQHAYPIAAAGSVAEKADLEIETLPVTVKCHQCGSISETQTNKLICKQCGNWQVQLLSGDELLLASLEFDVDHNSSDTLSQSNPEQGHAYV